MILATHRRGDGSVLAENVLAENVLAENPRAGSQALWLNLVLTAHSTLRGASAVWNVLREFVPGWPEAPDWTTGRTWLLRLGCDPLRRPQERATDGIWFLDHTVQIGPQKVLLILGIRASRLPVDRPLQLADLEPVALVPTPRTFTKPCSGRPPRRACPRPSSAITARNWSAGSRGFDKTIPERARGTI